MWLFKFNKCCLFTNTNKQNKHIVYIIMSLEEVSLQNINYYVSSVFFDECNKWYQKKNEMCISSTLNAKFSFLEIFALSFFCIFDTKLVCMNKSCNYCKSWKRFFRRKTNCIAFPFCIYMVFIYWISKKILASWLIADTSQIVCTLELYFDR